MWEEQRPYIEWRFGKNKSKQIDYVYPPEKS